MNPKIGLPFNGNFPITFRFAEAPEWYTKVFGYPHNGVDFAMPVGTIVRACSDGKAVFCDKLPDSNGLGIILSHDWGTSLYWHLSEVNAKEGSLYGRGQEIGKSGATGFATGPHLHFGIKVKGQSLPGMNGWCDPLLYLEFAQTPIPTPGPVLKYYIVRPGDTLWKISEKFYKNGYYWRKIFDANRDKIRDPALIYPFQRLLIP